MGKIGFFDIVYDNETGAFAPGDFVQGQIRLDLLEKIKIQGIWIQFWGRATFKGDGTSSSSASSSGSNFGSDPATETYYYYTLQLYEGGLAKPFVLAQFEEDMQLNAGEHRFPFDFKLPDVPSSFKANRGYIHHSAKATIKRPGKSDFKLEKDFNVIRPLDLNLIPNAVTPLHKQGVRQSGCLCCRIGPISAVFCINKTGYVPGEHINMSAEISNQSDIRVCSSVVKLIQHVLYHGKHSEGTEVHILARAEHPGIMPGESDIWSGESLTIPLSTPASQLDGCNIIDVKYILVLKVKLEGTPFNLEVPLDIIIGTVPLHKKAHIEYGVELAPSSLKGPI